MWSESWSVSVSRRLSVLPAAGILAGGALCVFCEFSSSAREIAIEVFPSSVAPCIVLVPPLRIFHQVSFNLQDGVHLSGV